jgi:hypothetical protein
MRGARAAWHLLLLLTALGIAGMHTLGHSSTHGDVPATSNIVSDMAQHLGLVDEATAAASGMIGAAGSLPLPDPFEVCVAILTAGLVALLVVVRRALARHRRADGWIGVSLRAAGRGPPWSGPIGLRLADLSVLRN